MVVELLDKLCITRTRVDFIVRPRYFYPALRIGLPGSRCHDKESMMHRDQLSSPKSSHRSTSVPKLFWRLVLIAAMLMVGQASPAMAASIPTVTGSTPSSGPVKGGQVIIIKGSDFTGTTAVSFGAVSATSYAVMSDTKIVAVVPDAAAAGSQLLTVTNATGPNTTGGSYTYGAPTVTKVDPGWATTSAAGTITITGTGFLGAVAADVKFGATAATAIWVISNTQLVATTPTGGSEGVVDVTVTRNSVVSDTSTTKSDFLFASGAPTLSALSGSGTDAVAVGSLLTLTGTQLLGVTTVYFGSSKVTNTADIVIASATSMTVKVPSRSNGPVDVLVETAAGTSLSNLSTGFNYYTTLAPTISSLTPTVFDKAATTGGGTFLVAGRGFTGLTTTDVTMKCTTDIVPTSVVPVSDTNVIVVIPGNVGSTAEYCDLEIANPVDGTKVTTETDAIRYV